MVPRDLRDRIAADQKAGERDLPDFTDMMLATGLRIGETTTFTWMQSTSIRNRRGPRYAVRITGKGLMIKWKPKGIRRWRKPEPPS
jgi:hypothetical protein